MTAKRRSPEQEPILNTLARKLGHAAGTLTKAAQDLTETLPALAGSATRVRPGAGASKSTAGSTRRPKKGARRAVRPRQVKDAAGSGKAKQPKVKSRQSKKSAIRKEA
jgi:hypothetical protein